jgi:hypothetical protein
MATTKKSCKHGKISRGKNKGRCRKRKLVTAAHRKLSKLDVTSAMTSVAAFAPSAPKRSRYGSANTSKAFAGAKRRRRR